MLIVVIKNFYVEIKLFDKKKNTLLYTYNFPASIQRKIKYVFIFFFFEFFNE